ncbi:molybdopterin-binding protein [Streptomyces bacillaris]|uniref:TOBE domain-containing protein n=1 Tax=unclassified Streptomyces TaxID=2593676 RepID=UPI00037DB0F9|nr:MULTISPECIES: TOBE domain-containing protein [unclassified Streptomyces]MYT37451.1 adenylate kinase [Streptomyces sp. SID8356]
MTLSIRNQISGTVTSLTAGEAMSAVRVRLTGGQDVTAAITTESVNDLGLTEGSEVRTLVKSTEVSLATGPLQGISIRNQIAGRVTDISTGKAMASVKIDVEGGALTAAITKDAVDELGLAVGSEVVALIKSTEVSLATA